MMQRLWIKPITSFLIGVEEREKGKELHYRPIGKGFIVHTPVPGGPIGRTLAMAYIDQYNRKYIEIDGYYEPLKETHSFLEVDW